MAEPTRFDLAFWSACGGLFLLLSAGVAWLVVQLSLWWIGKDCIVASTRCSAVGLLIDYWWLLYVPIMLLLALAARSLHARLRARNVP